MNTRILYLEHLMRHRTSSHSFSSVQDNSMDIPTNVPTSLQDYSMELPTDFPTGLSFFGSSSQATSDNQPRNRTSRRNQTLRTHQDMLTRCVRNESDETPNAGLANNGVICYANAIFQALANFNHLTSLFNDPLPDNNDGAFPLNHAFCTVLRSMVERPRNPELAVDPSNFVKLFTGRQ